MEKMNGNSKEIMPDIINFMHEYFPECFADGEIDHETVLNLFGEYKGQDREGYSFSWVGKKDAVRFSMTPSTATLIPTKEKSLRFESTNNFYIEGDNLEVLKLLQKTYYKKIKFIYIDPPYNTGKDFVYKDNYSNSVDNYKEITGQRLKSNPETSGRYHTDWLNMIYPRLKLAFNLLTDDGIIVLSIDDHEISNLKKVCDELFGEENCLGLLPRITKKSGKAHSDGFAKNHDYILVYCKSIFDCELNGQTSDLEAFSEADEYVDTRGKYKLNQTLDYDSLWYNPSMDFPLVIDGDEYVPGGDKTAHKNRHAGIHNPKDWVWRWSKAKFDFGYKNGFVVVKPGKDRPRIYTKTYSNAKIARDQNGNYYVQTIERENNISSLSFTENKYSNDNAKKELSQIIDPSLFDFPKPVSLVSELIKMVDEEGMIVLDFFSGSATTGQSVLELNKDGKERRFILVQLPELLEEDSRARQELHLDTLCDLAEYRLSEYIKKQRNNPITLFEAEDRDLGFKVFRLDSSNIIAWDGSKQYGEEEIMLFNRVIKDGRTDLDVAYEIMLKYGVFDKQLTEKQVNGKKMFSVDNDSMIICLADEITTDDVMAIIKLKPSVVVFKEAGFKDDNEKMNADYTLKHYLGEGDIKVLCI